MSLLRAYEIVAALTVYGVLRAMPRSPRRQVEDYLFRLTRQPSTRGEFEAPADDGRTHQVKLVGDWMVSYWPDQAAREIRLSAIEPIE